MSIFKYLVHFYYKNRGTLDYHSHGLSVTEVYTAYLKPCDMQQPDARN